MADTERSPRQVLDDHLEKARTGDVEQDLADNYDPALVILTSEGACHGHDGARFLADRLARELPRGSFDYRTVLVEGEIGFLEWSADSPHGR